MQVRIRHEGQDHALVFHEVADIDALEEFIRFLSQSGGVYYGGGMMNDITHQFVLDESGAYCELILSDE